MGTWNAICRNHDPDRHPGRPYCALRTATGRSVSGCTFCRTVGGRCYSVRQDGGCLTAHQEGYSVCCEPVHPMISAKRMTKSSLTW
ncbi:hypothetical protein AB205_0119210 [Aquarana catesbeiana]|uniref:Uncharacterized protein n=1 Tax=Aquarana catesbeiana TaxID=8400 RepID=A0A2G9RV49_AQUCT|nr:hypothetical protein AB205_0119210 [Aquarana catesbeiana]